MLTQSTTKLCKTMKEILTNVQMLAKVAEIPSVGTCTVFVEIYKKLSEWRVAISHYHINICQSIRPEKEYHFISHYDVVFLHPGSVS